MAIVPASDSDYSPTWKWQDEEPLEGTHVEFRKANTPDKGEVVVWEILSDKYGPVSVWVEPANLRIRVQRELRNRKRERGSAQLEPGERVNLNPGTKRPSKRNPGMTVWPFPDVSFEHGAPDRSAEELLLAGDDNGSNGDGGNDDEALAEAATEPPIGGGQLGPDDDLPFSPSVT